MRAALWFVGLFGLAVAIALFAGNNQGSVTLFWPPYRLDLSLNLALLLVFSLLVLLYAALRGLTALLALPHQAQRWRLLQKERAMHQTLVDGLSHLQAGRFVRARKSALAAIKCDDELHSAKARVAHSPALRAMAHMLAADCSHALQERELRDQHYALALEETPINGSLQQQELREGAQMRAARWALDDRDPQEALARLRQLPLGAARRTMALRIKLKAARLAHEVQSALDTARLLTKHGALSPTAGASMVRSLLLEQLQETHDLAQLQAIWKQMDARERQSPDIAMACAHRWLTLQGDGATARTWLLPIWELYLQQPKALGQKQTQRLFSNLQQSLDGLDQTWLARIETAHRQAARDPRLQYLAGMACMQLQLWGKAEQLLEQAAQRLEERELQASAWQALALLAEQRGDEAGAAQAWRQAANCALG